MALFLSILMACTGPDTGDTGSTDPTFGLALTLSEEVSTVLTARWQAEGAEQTWVEYAEGDTELVAPGLPDGDGGYEVALLGLHADTEVEARAVALVEGGRVEGEVIRASTGSLPLALPVLEVGAEVEGRTTEGWLVAKVGTPPAVAILDMDGRYVWWHLVPEPYNFARAILSVDGRSVVYMGWNNDAADGDPLVERVSLQGELLSSVELPSAHHDFAELPDGTLAMLVKDTIRVDDKVIKGEKIVEIAPDGTQTEAWSLWDHLNYDPDLVPSDPGDWAHANAIDYDAAANKYHVSFKNFDSIWQIDRSTGQVDWEFGGPRSAWRDAEDRARFTRNQHQFQLLDDGVLIFDNGTTEALDSRVVEYEVDWEAGLVSPRWTHHNSPALYCTALGDTARLPSGSTLITWSTLGQLDEVSSEGQVLWRLSAGLGGVFGYTTHLESLYEAP